MQLVYRTGYLCLLKAVLVSQHVVTIFVSFQNYLPLCSQMF